MLCSNCNQSAESLTDARLCGDCHVAAEERRSGIIDLARDYHQREGAVEIDDDVLLSEGNDNGCYVAAWVWVDFVGTPYDKHPEEENDEQQETTKAAQ